MPRQHQLARRRHLRHGAVVADQVAQSGEILAACQPVDRDRHLRGIGQEGVAVTVDQAGGLDVAMHPGGTERAVGGGVHGAEDAHHHQHQQARAVGRALPDVVAAPVAVDRGDEFGAVQRGGKIFLGMGAAVLPQGSHHVGGDRALVERLCAVAGDGAQGVGQLGLDEQVADRRRLPAGQEFLRPVVAQLAGCQRPVVRHAGMHRPAFRGIADGGLEQLVQPLGAVRCAQGFPGGHRARHGHAMGRGVFQRGDAGALEEIHAGAGRRPAGAVHRHDLT